VELPRSIVFLTAPHVTGFSLPDVVAHDPPILNMTRLSKFFNAPIAKLGRFSPELFLRKANKKFQKKEKSARGGASKRPEMSDPKSNPESRAAVIRSMVADFS
jgi:hypothetical protein